MTEQRGLTQDEIANEFMSSLDLQVQCTLCGLTICKAKEIDHLKARMRSHYVKEHGLRE